MLEVRLLYKNWRPQPGARSHGGRAHCRTARERGARSLTELASDWYWEQDANGVFTKVSGPVLEMLGLQVDPLDLRPVRSCLTAGMTLSGCFCTTSLRIANR